MGLLDDLISSIEGFVDGLAKGIDIELDNIVDLTTATVDAIWEAILGMKYVIVHYYDRTVDLVKKISVTLEGKIDDLKSGLIGLIDGVAHGINMQIEAQEKKIEETGKVLSNVVDGLRVELNRQIDAYQKATMNYVKESIALMAIEISAIADVIFNSKLFWELFETTIDEVW